MTKIEVLDKLIEMKWWVIERRIEVRTDPDGLEYQVWCNLYDQIKTAIAVVQEKRT